MDTEVLWGPNALKLLRFYILPMVLLLNFEERILR